MSEQLWWRTLEEPEALEKREWAVHVSSLPGVGTEDLLERPVSYLDEVSELGNSCVLNADDRSVGVAMVVGASSAAAAAAVASLLFENALRGVGLPDELALVGRIEVTTASAEEAS
jgi:hypothetical protein